MKRQHWGKIVQFSLCSCVCGGLMQCWSALVNYWSCCLWTNFVGLKALLNFWTLQFHLIVSSFHSWYNKHTWVAVIFPPLPLAVIFRLEFFSMIALPCFFYKFDYLFCLFCPSTQYFLLLTCKGFLVLCLGCLYSKEKPAASHASRLWDPAAWKGSRAWAPAQTQKSTQPLSQSPAS